MLNRDSAPKRVLLFLVGGRQGPIPEREIVLRLHCLNLGLGFVEIIQTGSNTSSDPASVTSHYFQ